jgi:hypothetical protein
MMSPAVTKPLRPAATPKGADLQTPAAAATPTQPPAKRQKAFNASFGFSTAPGQPRIDPVTGEEIWGEEEDSKPTPRPGFISTPAVQGGKAAAVFGGRAAAGKGLVQGGEEAGSGKGGSGGASGKKNAGAGGKKGAAATGKAAQKNIMSFFGKS